MLNQKAGLVGRTRASATKTLRSSQTGGYLLGIKSKVLAKGLDEDCEGKKETQKDPQVWGSNNQADGEGLSWGEDSWVMFWSQDIRQLVDYNAFRARGKERSGQRIMISEGSGLNDITWPESVDREEKRAGGEEASTVLRFRGREPGKNL